MLEWEIEEVKVVTVDLEQGGIIYEATALYGKRDVLPLKDRLMTHLGGGPMLPGTRAVAFARMSLLPDVRAGEIRVVGVDVTGEEVTGQLLRTLPVSRLVSEALAMMEAEGWPGLRITEVPDHVRKQWPRGDKELVAIFVAGVYKGATIRNIPPVPEVAEQFKVSTRTAARMIAHARETKHLPDVSPPEKTHSKKDQDNGQGETAAGETREGHD